MTELGAQPGFGVLLREWRRRRGVSQLALASGAGVSARHVSFVETGRSQPSREMVLRLAEHLDVPLRERNPMLLAAGHAPDYLTRDLDDLEMAPIRAALDKILLGYQPYPALVVDRGWDLVAANQSLVLLTAGVAPELLEPPVNVLRLSLHPRGLAPAILNLSHWRAHLLDRLAREAALTGDSGLQALRRELLDYPGGIQTISDATLAVPLRLQVGAHELVLLSTVTTFGTAVDITLAELSIEAFLPANESTAEALREFAGGTPV